jgi:hypothetical protein
LAVGGARAASEEELKLAYLYKFSQFTEWLHPPAGEIRFCLLGSNPFGADVYKLDGKLLEGIPIRILLPPTAEAARGCSLVYLNPRDRGELARWMRILNARPILTVSDYPDAYGENVIISLIAEPNQITFNINNTRARALGLSLSAAMLLLAREVR